LAAYATKDVDMTFFEIDPVVISVASDPRYFTYLSDAPRRPAIVEGDARLSIQAQPANKFDMLVLDAFSSDSPPVHLLTTEAIGAELRTLKPDGVLAIHVSSRYYDLTPPVAAAAVEHGLTILERWHSVGPVHEPGETPSHWLAAARDPAAITTLRADGWTDVTPADHPFTDDYADLLRYLRLGS
jgi:spermidine synthase